MKVKWHIQFHTEHEMYLEREDIVQYYTAPASSLKKCIKEYQERFTSEEYSLLKELIDSNDKANLLIAYEIITNK